MKPYYEDNQATIYNGDCQEVLACLPASGFDLIFTSPPYNLGNSTGGGVAQYQGHYDPASGMIRRGGRGKWKGAALASGYKDFSDNLPHAEYIDWQKSVLLECWKKLNSTGAIFYNHKPRVLNGVLYTPLEYSPELPVRQIIIWARAGGINFNVAFYMPTCEWIVVFAKPDFRLRDKAASGVGDVWRITQENNSLHPAPFPIELPKTAIQTTGAQMILDPFMGSGTTLRAAKDLGVKAVGIEISERYCEMAAIRLSQGVLEF